MHSVGRISLVVAVALVIMAALGALFGPHPWPSGARAQDMGSDEAQALMETMMGPMMERMMEGMLTAMLNVMSRPETAEQLSAFTKNYYDALQQKGFSKQEALQIVVATGLPSIPSMK